MKITNRLLIIAAFFALVLPLMFTVNASALNNFNSDGAVLNGTTGLWELPTSFCVSYPDTWDGTGAVPDAVKRADRTTYNPNTSDTACSQLSSATYYPTQRTAVRALDRTTCESKGYVWSSYSSVCSPSSWTSDIPGDSTFPTWYTAGYNSCMTCHNDRDDRVSATRRSMSNYINASHKNASRKIVPGKGLANIWIDTNDVEQFGVFPYLPGLNSPQTDSTVSPNHNIRMVDWVNGKIEDTTANSSHVGLRNLPTGVYTDWYWEFGYYGEDPERGMYASIADKNGKPAAKQAGCFFCHGTGLTAENTVNAAKEPERSFPGISWDGTTTYTKGSRISQVNLQNSYIRSNDGTTLYDPGLCAEVGGTAYGTTSSLVTYTYPFIGSITESMNKTLVGKGAGTCTSSCDADNDGDGVCEANETCKMEDLGKTPTAVGGNCTSGCDADNDGNGICNANETCADVAVTVNDSYKCVKTGVTKAACEAGGTTTNAGFWAGAFKADDPYFAITGTDSCTYTFTYKYNSWDEFGVTCSNCHNAVDGNHQNTGNRKSITWTTDTAIEGASINAVCGQCHVKASSSTGQVYAPDAEAVAARKNVGTGHPNYHASDFLNSPHARFTGTYGQISDPAQYGSAFLTSAGGCEGCHNPHGSVREPLHELATGSAVPQEGIEATCASCHTSVTTFRHPTDPNKPTPWGTPDACVTCHMPSGRHMFRITTDTNYTTTQPTAFPVKPDGTFTEAVWVDLKSSCQQCHNGHVEGIPFIQTSDLRNFAVGMHGGPVAPEALTATITPVATGMTVAFTATGCPDADCTYKWNFGDDVSANTTTATTSHTYAAAGNYSAQVIVVDDTTGNNGSKSTAFALSAAANVAPVAAMSITQSGFTVNVIDASTDDAALPAGAVTVDWGNGTTSTGNALATISKTYTLAGTYIIKHKVTDAGGKVTWSANTSVTVPVKYNVSGSVMRGVCSVAPLTNTTQALCTTAGGTWSASATPVSGASIRLKNGAQVVKMTTTNAAGAYTLQSVNPGSYTVEAVKSGLTFTGTPAAVVTNANVSGIDITATR